MPLPGVAAPPARPLTSPRVPPPRCQRMPVGGRAPSLPALLPQHPGQLPLLLPPRVPPQRRQGLLRRYRGPPAGRDAPNPRLPSVTSVPPLPGYPKSILAPSPILQSLQHPPTLLLLPPGSGGPLLVPRGSPSPHFPAAAPGTQIPPSSPSTPRAVGPPGTATPSSPHCWHRGAPRETGTRWTEPGCRSCTCQVSPPMSPPRHQYDVGLNWCVPFAGGASSVRSRELPRPLLPPAAPPGRGLLPQLHR